MIADNFSRLVKNARNLRNCVTESDIPLENNELSVTQNGYAVSQKAKRVTQLRNQNPEKTRLKSIACDGGYAVTRVTQEKYNARKNGSDKKTLSPAAPVNAVFKAHGFTLSIGTDGNVQAHGLRPLAEKERGALEQSKDGLLGELRQAPAQDVADRQEAYLERCAILQYDGNMTRREAERRAGTCYYCRHWQGTKSGRGWCVRVRPPVQRQADDTCERFKV